MRADPASVNGSVSSEMSEGTASSETSVNGSSTTTSPQTPYKLSGKASRKGSPRRHPAFRGLSSRPRLEPLEDRVVPSTYMVTNTGDNGGINPTPGAGTGTLRQAIVDASGQPSPVIAFNNPTSDSGQKRRSRRPTLLTTRHDR